MKNLLSLSTLLFLFGQTIAQTTYTWDGSSSSAWATAANWTPSGTPTATDHVIIVNASNDPVLSANVTVANFTITSGELTLSGHTISVSGTLTCSGGEVNNGTLTASGSSATFSGAEFGAVVTVVSASVLLNGSDFNSNASFTKTGSGNDFGSGGNTFADTATFVNSGAGYFVLGNSAADTFVDVAYFSSSGNFLAVAYNSTGNLFEDDIYLSNSGSGIIMNHIGTAEYRGNIHVTCSAGTISFGNGSGSATLTSGNTIIEGASPFTAGELKLKNFTKLGSIPMTLDFGSGQSSFFIAENSSLYGDITYSGGIYHLDRATFNGNVSFANNYNYDLYVQGGNIFNGNATFINNSNSDVYLANALGEDFNADVTYTETNTGKLYPGYNSTSTYAGSIEGYSTDKIDFGAGSTIGRNILDGSGQQVMTGTADQLRFKKLNVNKPSGSVQLGTVVAVYDTLNLTSGVVRCNDSYFVIHDNVKVLGANNASHIEGRVAKVGDDAFAFPVGRNGSYRPIAMSGPSTGTDIYYSEYFEGNSDWKWNHVNKQSGLADISLNEYWYLQRYAGTSNVNVTLSWDTATSCAFDTLANLRVTAFDTTGSGEWKNLGNGGTTGNVNAGTVVTGSASGVFGAYALGTIDKFSCTSGAGGVPTEALLDSAGIPRFMKHSIIVRFNPQFVVEEAVDDLDIVSADLPTFLATEVLDTLETILPSSLDRYRLVRIFRSMTTNDTISINRLGEEIRVPKFWSAFALVIPEGDSIEVITSKLNEARPYVHYAHFNYVAIATSTPTCQDAGLEEFEPDDPLFSGQTSLDADYTNDPPVGINVINAWRYETGRSDIRVGIFDSGLRNDHADLLFNGTSVVKEAWNMETDTDLYSSTIPDNLNNQQHAHGTWCAGIIGAVRNNTKSIAGIAGGNEASDPELNQEGVSLYGLRIYRDAPDEPNFSMTLMEIADAVNGSAMSAGGSNTAYAYALNVANNSWGIYFSDIDPALTPTSLQLLNDAYHFANRNHVTVVAARGNDGYDVNQVISPYRTNYPACFDDKWIINVGATGAHGAYAAKINGTQDWMPNIGGGIDVAAPGVSSIITTLNATGNTTFSGFGGTSGATAHVSGVAALLMSRTGQPALAPEDVEWLLEKTATDAMLPEQGSLTSTQFAAINTVGYDDYIGWGRVNAGDAMALLNNPEYDLRHYDTPSGAEYALEEEGVSIILAEPSMYEDVNGLSFSSGSYIADVYRVYTSGLADLGPNEVIVDENSESHPGYWPRHSSSNLFPPLEQVGDDLMLLPHEHISIARSSNIFLLTGYTYKLYSADDPDEFLGWFPVDPTTSSNVHFAYSVLLHDLDEVPCIELETDAQEIEENTIWATDIFPCGDVVVRQGNCLP